MAHIVYCWEQGSGLGHMMPLAALSAEMVRQGHRVTTILCDMTHAPRLLSPHGIEWLPAPKLAPLKLSGEPVNHADIMHRHGYDTPERLLAQLSAWRSMFGLLRPDRVVCEYAPTARLAADTLGLSPVCVDSGFYMPPLSDPLPLLRDHEPVSVQAQRANESRTLDVVNATLMRLGCAPRERFAQLFEYPVWYRNWPAFNHFRPHAEDRHLGQVHADSGGAVPVWPSGEGPRLFAYLKPGHPEALPVLRAAIAQGFRVLAYLPGFPRAVLAPLLQTQRIVVSGQPVRLGELDEEIDIGVWNSPTGAVARCLQNGMRMIFLPSHMEQMHACRAVARAGLPAYVSLQREDWPAILGRVMGWPRLARDARWQPADVAAFALRLAEA